GDGGSSVLYSSIEMLQALTEIVATERAGRERGNDSFNLMRDDVALDEIRHVKNLAEDALGENVLDNHLFDSFNGDIGIYRTTAEGAEVFERGDELLIGLAFLFDEGSQALANLRDFVAEFLDGLFPFCNGWRREFEEELEYVNKIFGFGQVRLEMALAVLEKHGAVRLPEKDILLRIASGELIFN